MCLDKPVLAQGGGGYVKHSGKGSLTPLNSVALNTRCTVRKSHLRQKICSQAVDGRGISLHGMPQRAAPPGPNTRHVITGHHMTRTNEQWPHRWLHPPPPPHLCPSETWCTSGPVVIKAAGAGRALHANPASVTRDRAQEVRRRARVRKAGAESGWATPLLCPLPCFGLASG